VPTGRRMRASAARGAHRARRWRLLQRPGLHHAGPPAQVLGEGPTALPVTVVRRGAPSDDQLRVHARALLRTGSTVHPAAWLPPRARHRDAVRHAAVLGVARQSGRSELCRRARSGVRPQRLPDPQPPLPGRPRVRSHPSGLRPSRSAGTLGTADSAVLRHGGAGRLPPALRGSPAPRLLRGCHQPPAPSYGCARSTRGMARDQPASRACGGAWPGASAGSGPVQPQVPWR
jgi:hypothetical protein